MACMEDLLLQNLKAYATFCLCGFLKDLIYELILFAFMYNRKITGPAAFTIYTIYTK